MAEFVVYKCTMFFEGRGHGWTETHWYQSALLDYGGAMGALRILARHRANLLADPCRVKALRVSREDQKNEALLEYVNLRPELWSKEQRRPLAAAPPVCLLIRCMDQNFKYWKHVFLRGIPDAIENDFGEYVPLELGEWNPALQKYLSKLQSGGVQQGDNFGWMRTGEKVKSNLVRHVVQPDDRVRFEFEGDIFPARMFGNKTRLRMKGINGKSELNRLHVVDVLGPRQAVTSTPLAAVTWRFGGQGIWQEEVFQDYEHCKDMKITRRAPGAPLLLPVGRQKARLRV